MYKKPLSLIIPCHNSAPFLSACLDSIRKQTLGVDNMHVILVDDASDDQGATLHMLEAFREEFPDSVTVLALERNLRQGGARNQALQHVDTDYIQFLDSDDWLDDNACLDLLKMIDGERADLLLFGHELEESDFRIDLPDPDSRKIFLSSRAWNANHSSKVYRADLILDHGIHFAEDRYFEEPLFVYPTFFYASSIVFARRHFYHLGERADHTMSSTAQMHLMDHPAVQMELLEFLKAQELLSLYHDEIEDYFLWTYFMETVLNAGVVKDSLSLGEFAKLQERCRSEFPNHANNPYLPEHPKAIQEILSGIDLSFSSQEELDAFLQKAQACYSALISQ